MTYEQRPCRRNLRHLSSHPAPTHSFPIAQGLDRWTGSKPEDMISYCHFLTVTLFRGRRIRGQMEGR